jgi:hypothetical protein
MTGDIRRGKYSTEGVIATQRYPKEVRTGWGFVWRAVADIGLWVDGAVAFF